MAKIDDFFTLKNTVTKVSEENQKAIENYLIPIKAFARTTYKSINIIDYNKKRVDFVSDNPLFLCKNTAYKVKDMEYDFYLKHVIEEGFNLLLKINTIGFDYYEKVPLSERLDYTISYDLKKQANKIYLSELEKEILHFSIKVYTIKEISEQLFVSSETIKFHRKNLFTKLNVNNMSEALVYAIGK